MLQNCQVDDRLEENRQCKQRILRIWIYAETKEGKLRGVVLSK